MSHVFGLRAANSPETKANKAGTAPRARIPSDSTHRTVSSSSYLSTEGQSDYPSTISSFGSIKRPLMVRDYSQVIGIKKDMAPEAGKVNININTDLLLPPTEVSSRDMANLTLAPPAPLARRPSRSTGARQASFSHSRIAAPSPCLRYGHRQRHPFHQLSSVAAPGRSRAATPNRLHVTRPRGPCHQLGVQRSCSQVVECRCSRCDSLRDCPHRLQVRRHSPQCDFQSRR